MKNTSSTQIPFFLVVVYLFCTFYSCSDDKLITPPIDTIYHFDSARFNYKVIHLEGKLFSTGDLWSTDTSEVFIVNPFQSVFLHVKNEKVFTFTDPNFIPGSISGISNNEVYISGLLMKNNLQLPGVKKWNGISLEDFPINLTFDKPTFINKSLIRSSSDMWLFCNNIIIRKDGNNFSTFKLEDTISVIESAYFDDQNIPTFIQVYFNTSLDSLQTIKAYQFRNNNWENVYEAYENRHYVYDSFNRTTFCKRDLNDVYTFTNNNFTPFFSNDVLEIFSIGGTDVNNFMVFSFNKNGFRILNWDGQKWSQEFTNYIGIGSLIFPINKDLYYFFADNFGSNYTNLIRANR